MLKVFTIIRQSYVNQTISILLFPVNVSQTMIKTLNFSFFWISILKKFNVFIKS
jgi:hypothetical protein